MKLFLPSSAELAVSLLILPDCSMMSVACSLDPMRAANRIAGRPVFSWKILTLDGNPVILTCGLPIIADAKFGDVAAADMLIIIAGFDSHIHADKSVLARLVRSSPHYGMIGAIEAGPWLLARSGMLDGFRATTHWEDFEDFAGSFPKIEVIPDRYVVDGRFFTTGGASPTFDLMLYLIRSRLGTGFAMEVAKVFIYEETHRAADAQNLISVGRPGTGEPRIAAAIKLMQAHLDEPKSIQSIANFLNMSLRALEILFVRILQIAPGRYYRQLRFNAARRMVVDTGLSIQQIAVRTGFNSSSAFSRAFKNYFGENPMKLRRRNERGADNYTQTG